VGEGTGEGVGKYGDDGSKIGGSVIALFGLVLFVLNHTPRNVTVATIDIERITRRIARRFRG
jgi:hypothetical protein